MILEVPDKATRADAQQMLDAALVANALLETSGVHAAAARLLGLTREGFYKLRMRVARRSTEATS